MALTKKDLGQIKEVLSEAMVSEQYKESIKATVSEAMVSEQYKESIKATVSEAMVSEQYKESIKATVSEAMVSEQYKESIKATVSEAMVSEPIKKVLKETMLEVMEPMMIASQKEFDKIGEQLNDMNERLVDLNKNNTQAHEDAGLRLNNMAYRFELADLKKRVEVLEKKTAVHV